MVLGEAAAASAAGVHALWDYNRANYLYDREMRQEQEFQILEYRNRQAELWREDVRDLIGLTEKKMDSYLVAGTVQLGMCVTLLTEGRLEPGTPHWLLRLFVLSLTAAFIYLLMSVWLAMHASVVAQSSSVRLLTQLVRLPVPSWEQLEATRTYASSYEELPPGQVLRVPFASSPMGAAHRSAGVAAGRGNAGPTGDRGSRQAAAADPWGLEKEGTDIYELQHKPAALLRHVKLVRRAAAQYQCHDAFARVCMTLGTNQLLFATSYFCLGYVTVQDGAPWPAFSAIVVLMAAATGLVRLDLSLTLRERLVAQALIVAGPACASLACCAWSLYTPAASLAAQLLLPFAFAAHCLWLLWVLRMCAVQEQPNGAMLPTKFRAVLYLDVFGWLLKKGERRRGAEEEAGGEGRQGVAVEEDEEGLPGLGRPLSSSRSPPLSSSRESTLRLREEQLRRDLELWESEKVQSMVDEADRARIGSLAQQFRSALSEDAGEAPRPGRGGEAPASPPPPPARWLRLRGYADTGEEVAYLYDACSSSVLPASEDEAGVASTSSRSARAGGEGRLGRAALTLSFTEERVQSFCERRRSRPSSRPAQAQPSVHAAASPSNSRMRGLLDWCEDVHPAAPSSPPRTRLGPGGIAAAAGGSGSMMQAMATTAEGRAVGRAARRSMTFSRPSEDFDCSPMRPEDVEVASAGLEMEAHQARLDKGLQDDHRTLRGVGPAAAVPSAPHDTFDPASFYPEGRSAASNAPLDDAEDEVVTGGDKLKPGQMPWQAFRAATRLFVGFWAFAALLALPGVDSYLGFHTLTLPQVMASLLRESGGEGAGRESRRGVAGEMEAGLPLLSAGGEARRRSQLPMLPGGEPLAVEWPKQFSFSPRVIGCDFSGRQLAVADDFGIYAGRLEEAPLSSGSNSEALGNASLGPPHGSLGAQPLHLRLRTAAPGPSQTPTDAPLRRLVAHFRRQPPCTALEGQTLKDIGLVCSKGSSCHVLVLHARGRRIAECPLAQDPSAPQVGATPGPAGAENDGGTALLPPKTDGALPGLPDPAQPVAVRPSIMWEISGGWLNATKERVESVAIDGECGGEDSFMPDDPGCVVVGTTSGRIVQLRRHVSDKNQLVPEWAMGQHSRKVGQGSLHVLAGGLIISLRPGGTVQALDGWEGTEVGEWQLPSSVQWHALCGGGKHLYVLGRQGPRREAALWRFAVPAELEARRRRPRGQGEEANTGRYHEM